MTQAQLEAAFTRAVSASDGAYAVARAEVLQDPGARAYLTAQRASSAWQVRLTADILLGWLDHKPLYDQAQEWVKDESRRPSRTVIGVVEPWKLGEQLAKLGTTVTPRVYEMWQKTHEYDDEHEGYEEDVLVSALEALRDPRMFEPMLALLTDRRQPDSTRMDAASVLKALGDTRSVPALLAILKDASHSDDLRKVAAGAALKLARDDAREPIEGVAADPAASSELRIWLVSLLMELADARSLPVLTKMLDGADAADEGLIGMLCSTIAELGDKSQPSTMSALQRARQRGSDDVKRDCDNAIITLQRK